MADLQTLHFDSAWSTQDGSHMAFCWAPGGMAATLATPTRMQPGDAIQAERAGRDWRFVSTTAEAAPRP